MRRRWISLLRICRYGFNNFSRNAWLSTAATLVMVVTLLVLLTTFTARMIFNDTLDKIREKIDVTVFLVDEITVEQLNELKADISKLEIVSSIDHVSKEQAREIFKSQNKPFVEQLEALGELGEYNPFPASLRIILTDPNRLNEVTDLVNQDKYLALQSESNSTAQERRAAIETIARAASFSEIVGLVASIVFVVLSVMTIFNTIRMAIFNRRDEIEIMKLIGASKNFIRGPFIVEASLYGVFAAVISIALMYGMLLAGGPYLRSYQDIEVNSTLNLFTHWPLVILAAQLGIGVGIGVISSLLAIRRYLKL